MRDIVLLKEAATECNSWLMEKIVATNADKNVYKIYMLGASGTTDMTL